MIRRRRCRGIAKEPFHFSSQRASRLMQIKVLQQVRAAVPRFELERAAKPELPVHDQRNGAGSCQVFVEGRCHRQQYGRVLTHRKCDAGGPSDHVAPKPPAQTPAPRLSIYAAIWGHTTYFLRPLDSPQNNARRLAAVPSRSIPSHGADVKENDGEFREELFRRYYSILHSAFCALHSLYRASRKMRSLRSAASSRTMRTRRQCGQDFSWLVKVASVSNRSG